ncbi:hypothetical protein KKE68_08255 [Patescibacteria group bacterium]|nr:hypothetical protein [Patescibacteria group bacterium]
MKIKRKILAYLTLIILSFSLFSNYPIFADEASSSADLNTTITPTPTDTQNNDKELEDLNKKIHDLEQKVNDLKKQENSLSSQIDVMDNQIQLTQYRINVVQEQINDTTLDIDTAGKKIKNLEGSLNNVTKVLLSRIVATYQAGEIDPVRILLASSNLQEFLSRENYLKIVQEHDKELLFNTQQAKVDYANQKSLLEGKKKKILALQIQLDEYNKQLDQEKIIKQDLLSITKNDEDKYQQLLATARSEYEAIQGIVAGKGEETLVGHVNEGERIASVIQGSSCNSDGAHLHFIVNQNGNNQNPFNYLRGGSDYENCSGSSCGSSDGDAFNPSGNWEWPINPKISINQGYGSTWAIRNTWVGRIYSFHNGLDINSNTSSEAKAVKSGNLYRGSFGGGGGCRLRYVKLNHDEGGIESYYLHVNY